MQGYFSSMFIGSFGKNYFGSYCCLLKLTSAAHASVVAADKAPLWCIAPRSRVAHIFRRSLVHSAAARDRNKLVSNSGNTVPRKLRHSLNR